MRVSGRRRQRIFLVTVLTLGVISVVWFRLGGGIADDRAEAVESELAQALERHSPDEFLGWAFDAQAAEARRSVATQIEGGDLEGGPVDEFRFSVRTWWAIWEPRCVLARAADSSTWDTHVARDFCDDADWPVEEPEIP